MRGFTARKAVRFAIGASTLALTGLALPAAAQDSQPQPDANATMGQPGNAVIPPPAPGTTDARPSDGRDVVADNIIVTGIRAGLRRSIDLKRNAQGVVDGISAEDIGKFPDTNLAESLQRITGVSIDRSNGEGSLVTVRGFGPEYNLVTLNGRYMPTAFLANGDSPPNSRAFDFANLTSEGVASLEVYKSGRATVASGGIGALINIRTPRPFDKAGFRASVAAKGVIDTSRNGKNKVTPEVSGIFSDTFFDDRVGVLLTGTYQKRLGSVNSYNSGFRDGYLGSENNWGSLAQPGTPRAAQITNRPGPNDVYQVPQNGGYDIVDLDRVRINGQAVLQYRPFDSLVATVDYTFSQNTVKRHDSSVGIWFNHADTTSAWTNGPVAGPIFYSEAFQRSEGKDLAYSGSYTSNRTRNKSVGANLTWKGIEGLTLTVDAHHSTARAAPTNQYGSSNSVGNAIFGIQNQTINFEKYLPVISYTMYPGIDPLNAALITPTGNAFRRALFTDRINQAQLQGHYDVRRGVFDSVDFGFNYVDNKVRSAYGYIQNDTWGGAGPASAIPDDIFKLVSIPDKFSGLSGAKSPNIIQKFYSFDFKRMVALIDSQFGTCGGDGDCRVPYTVDRRITERTYAPYLQVNTKADLFGRPAHLLAGVRYEKTNVDSSALVPIPTGTRWVSANEFSVIFSNQSGFTTFKGHYDNWLPNVDFDVSPIRDVVLRASYSHTIARADYGSLQGGQTLDQLFRIDNGFGSRGNPGLLPYKSKNIDLSAEWYYHRDDYISVGFFHKDVSNFIGQTRVTTPAFGLTNPADGPRYDAAIAALGPNATTTDIRNYIFRNFPATTKITGTDANGNITGEIYGQPNDKLLPFQISTPVNSDQKAKIHGFEFAIQHNFWDTGFGTILNYTIVRGDAKYNNALPASVTQFALLGLSDSANAVLFYDKGPIQGRVAYNWRAGFLTAGGPNPTYVQSYGQLDGQVSYQFNPHFSIFGEGINMTGSNIRQHQRSYNNANYVLKQAARWSFGARYVF